MKTGRSTPDFKNRIDKILVYVIVEVVQSSYLTKGGMQ